MLHLRESVTAVSLSTHIGLAPQIPHPRKRLANLRRAGLGKWVG